MKTQSRTRCGYVAIVGRPNVGKSTLLNALVGAKLSIVTPKPQTTRTVVLGIITDDEAQLILLDTPGLLEPRYRLQEAMVQGIRRALKDADVMLLLLDAELGVKGLGVEERRILSSVHIPTVVAINKVDIATDQVLTDVSEALQEYGAVQHLILLSALKGKNVSELGALLKALLPAGPFFYPPDLITQQPERFFVAELIREKILSLFRQEVPYSTAVLIEEYKEREPKNYIRATIYVERESQKTILVGTNGSMLKKVGQRARRDIERFTHHPVYLELWVKVREKWRKSERDLRELGYLE